MTKKLALITLAILIFATFVNSLNNAFLSDDLAEIVQKPTIGDFSAIFTYWTAPIRHIIYYLAYHIGGLTPFFFRITNVFFHLGSTFLVYLIIQSIYKSKNISLIVASIFAVHPAIAEAVVWISGGMYAQYTFFFLASFYFYITPGRRNYFLSILFYLFSLMSHPVMPIALFVIFPLYELCFGNFKKNWTKVIPFLTISLMYVFKVFLGLGEREQTLQQVHLQEKGVDNPFIQIPIAISSYFELIFFPKTLTLYHSELAFGPISFTIRALITLAFFGLILFSFFKKKSIFFWASLFLIALSPTLTPFRLNWIVAERYLYLPSIGIFVLVALSLDYLIRKFPKYKQALVSLICIVVILLSIRTIIRNIDWKNEDNLWIATGKTSPSSPNTHNNLGDVYGRQGDKQKALEEFQTAILLKPNYADAYHNLANTYRELGATDSALINYQKALEFNPRIWQSYQNIAAIYFEQKNYDLALDYMQKALTVNPNTNLANNLGVIYLAKGDKEKAKEIFTQILAVDPQNQLARQGLIEANK